MSAVTRGFVAVGDREVHYRTSGSGPLVVLLHDSPRSSALHLPLLNALSDRFTVLALDTPGNGASSPLPGSGLQVADFSTALIETLDALGVERAGFYGTHTSSKILLDFAVRSPDRISVAILDGLSLPAGGPDPAYIAKYMRPFEIDDDGAYIGREWTRLRDQGRWFPWYSRDPAHRTVTEGSPPAQAHQAAIDYFSSGPNYIGPYTAAMNYRAATKLLQLKSPTYIMARSDDVLFSHLERLPDPLPACCTVERLTNNRQAWEERVRTILLDHALPAPDAVLRSDLPDAGTSDGPRSGYVSLATGQMRYRRYGSGDRRPIVYLPETPGGSGGSTDFLEAIGEDRPVWALDLPGYGLSDALAEPTADAFADAVITAIEKVGSEAVDLIAEFTATPLALRVLALAPTRVHRCVLDGILLAEGPLRAGLSRAYCPTLRYETSGAHLHRAWHMLRDQEIQWPWYDSSEEAARRGFVRIDGPRLHQRLLEVVSQMDHYGDACQAAFASDAHGDLKASRSRLLVTAAADPRHAWSQTASDLSPGVEIVERGETASLRAAQYRSFLDRS